jgi:hypothetical protein
MQLTECALIYIVNFISSSLHEKYKKIYKINIMQTYSSFCLKIMVQLLTRIKFFNLFSQPRRPIKFLHHSKVPYYISFNNMGSVYFQKIILLSNL